MRNMIHVNPLQVIKRPFSCFFNFLFFCLKKTLNDLPRFGHSVEGEVSGVCNC